MDDSTSQEDSHQHDNNTSHDHAGSNRKHKERLAFGLDSFDAEAQALFGNNVRVSMSFMDGSAVASESDRPEKAMPSEASAIALRLKQLGQDIASNTADQLELLVRFDDLEGWRSSGARHCVAWMNLEMGISSQLGWEYLRVGRKLRTLPIIRALFRAGNLTWSIVRLLSRVAGKDNEARLCHTALDASVSEVERLCTEYRWQQDDEENGTDGEENARSLQQINARAFSWKTISNGNTLINLSLPPEVAQGFLNSVEQSLAQLEVTDASMRQRRADAAVLMAENSLQNAGRDMAIADRYQVIVSVDWTEHHQPAQSEQCQQIPATSIPEKRATIHGAGSIATETARRIACDCSVSTITHSGGEPVDIGRKTRLWPPGMARAIKHRDQHCQFPGCTQSRHLQIHHIQHWADGGSTCVDNGVCICAYHHTVVHEGGYRMERVNDQQTRLDEQFKRQMATPHTINEFEKLLRDSRESFEQVRATSPTRFRFRIVNQEGQDIRDTTYEQKSQNQQVDQRASEKSEADICFNSSEDMNSESTDSVPTSAEPMGSEPTRVEFMNSEPTSAEPMGSGSTRVESMNSEPTSTEPMGSGSTRVESMDSEPARAEPKSTAPMNSETTFVDQWWEGIKDAIRTDWPGVEEESGHYCIVEQSV